MGASHLRIKELWEFGGTSLFPKLLYPPEVQTVGHTQTSVAVGGTCAGRDLNQGRSIQAGRLMHSLKR